MINCQYLRKKPLLWAFLGIGISFAFISSVAAQVTIKPSTKSPEKPVVTIKPSASVSASISITPKTGIDSLEIQKVVDDAMKIIDAKIEEEKAKKKKEIIAKLNLSSNSPELAKALSAVDVAFAAIREGARMRVQDACTGLKCDAEKIQEIAEAYVTKTAALDFLNQYNAFVMQSITDTEKQLAELNATMDLFDAKIKENEGWFFSFLPIVKNEIGWAKQAREKVESVKKEIQKTKKSLTRIQEIFAKLDAGINNASLSEEEARKLIQEIKISLLDIQRAMAFIMSDLNSGILNYVVTRHAPDIDLQAKRTELEQQKGQVDAKLKEFESKKAKEMQEQLFKVLPVKVDLTKSLPQIVMPQPKPVENPKPNPVSIKPFIEPPADPAPKNPSVPSMKPPVMPAPRPTTILVPVYRNNAITGYEERDPRNLPTLPAGWTYQYQVGKDGKTYAVPVRIPGSAPAVRTPVEAVPTYR